MRRLMLSLAALAVFSSPAFVTGGFNCAVKDRNEDAFAALSQEFERSSRILAEEWAQTSALAKIAVISESND